MWQVNPESEDCLFLQIATPAKKEGKKYAVLVWIHGGAFFMGSKGDNVNYESFAKDEIIIVGINYRLGIK